MAAFLTSFINTGLFFILIYGFLNQVTTYSEAIKFYIPIVFAAAVIIQPLTLYLFSEKVTSLTIAEVRHFYTGAIVCLLAVLGLYQWTCSKIPEVRWHSTPVIPHFNYKWFIPILAFAITGLGMFLIFYNFIFSYKVSHLYTKADDYTSFFANFSLSIGIGSVIISILCLLFGPWLLREKGWRTTALITPVLLLIGFALFTAAYSFNALLMPASVVESAMLRGFEAMLIFPVLQIAYLIIPQVYRFQAKAWAEILIGPVLAGLTSALGTFILMLTGTIANSIGYFFICAFVILLLLIWAIFYIGRRVELSKTL